jgi:hypothetical protein
MVETIVPVVHGEKRSRYWFSVALHVTGASISAAALGALLGAVGGLVGAPWGAAGAAAVAAVAGLYALREATGLPVWIPDRHRQVPDWWRTFFSAPVASFLYGVGLGVGFLTFLTYGTFVAVSVAAVATGDPLLGAAICLPFGLARALTVVLSRRATSAESAARIVDRLERLALRRLPRLANAAALTAVALVAVGVAA